MSLDTNQVLTELVNSPRCLSRSVKLTDPSNRLRFNVGCIPKNATKANEAQCPLELFRMVVPLDITCNVVTSQGWANTAVNKSATAYNCLSTCSIVPATNVTASSSVSNVQPSSTHVASASLAHPNFLITFASLLFIFSIIFSKHYTI